IGTIDATGRSASFRACTAAAPSTNASPCFNGVAANPGYTLSAVGTSHNYFFSERGAFRTDSRTATDLALSYTAPPLLGKVTLFARADLLNVFDEQVIIDPAQLNTDVVTSRSGGLTTFNADGTVRTGPGLRPFNPKTDTPIECPRGASAQACWNMGANFQYGPNFGKASGASAYQVADRSLAPRTYRFTFGIRF
ncbi:MAG TPA: hypothetical protein VN181_08855, partial [Thermoanaerobaculia bacterium]|nr:hypothetical protein [Thermoanaerobaculia bacterium]